MTFDYAKIEKEQDAFQTANKIHFDNFRQWLESKALSAKTINNHLFNVSFYINDFVCYYEDLDIKSGCYAINSFLGDFFIRKVAWPSCAKIKATAASVKKFYAFMLESNHIKKEDYDALCEIIKKEMPDWLATMEELDAILEEEDEDDYDDNY